MNAWLPSDFKSMLMFCIEARRKGNRMLWGHCQRSKLAWNSNSSCLSLLCAEQKYIQERYEVIYGSPYSAISKTTIALSK